MIDICCSVRAKVLATAVSFSSMSAQAIEFMLESWSRAAPKQKASVVSDGGFAS